MRDITPEDLEGLPVGGYIVRAEDLEESDALIGFFRGSGDWHLHRDRAPGGGRGGLPAGGARGVARAELAGELLAGLSETLVPFDGENFGEVLPERWEIAQQIMIDAASSSRRPI